MKAQPLNIQKSIIVSMGYSSIYESDFRRPHEPANRGHVGLHAATEWYKRVAKKGLYLLCARHIQLEALEGMDLLLKSVPMDGSIALLVDGAEAAERVSSELYKQTGKPVGIALYNGSPSVSYLFAEDAAETASRKGKPFHISTETYQKSPLGQI